MNILWLTWKDSNHPQAGGAELVASEICKRLVGDGHRITMLTCGYQGAATDEVINGIRFIRVGNNRYSHSLQALIYYLRHMRGKFDFLIEEVNGGAPYFCVWFAGGARRAMLYHQLARINWLYEIKRPVNYVGYHALVPMATKLASLSKTHVVTVSESTRQILAEHGFDPGMTHIISEGIEIEPLSDLESVQKSRKPTLLSLGSMRAMKRTLDHIVAFEIAKHQLPDLRLKIAGSADTDYGKQVLARLELSPFQSSIQYLGKVKQTEKMQLMQQSHIILQTAIEEGWGLTITEAASQGTPAVAYNVAGLRDSIRNGVTGVTTDEHPVSLARGIVDTLQDTASYEAMRHAGWEWSKRITFERCYNDFKQVLQTA